MPKCKECGKYAKRLQWTHFKYKCTGRFNNGKEYKKAYPGAKLVDDELAKRTAVTKANLIKKYGEAEGTKAWNNYCNKQAMTNSFEYKQEKYGWTKEQYDDYNKSRSVTLENLVKRHGDTKGTLKWMTYCERQAYTNTEAYFIEQYGKESGKEKYKEVCRLKTHTVPVVAERNGCSIEEATTIRENYKQNNLYQSKAEIEFATELSRKLGTELQFSVLTKQYAVWVNDKINFYDIVHNNKAIEFNGDYWHCNPAQYEPNYYHTPTGLLAEDIWHKDMLKLEGLKKERGIDTLVIWWSDYVNNPEESIKRCVKWLT